MCFAHDYTEHEKFGCNIIHRNSLAGQKFVSTGSNIYLKGKRYCIFLKYLETGRQEQFKIFNLRVWLPYKPSKSESQESIAKKHISK